MLKLEVRTYTFELRSGAGEGDAKKMVGHASVFNQPTNIGGYFVETVKPGAFAKTIGKDDIRALFNHDPNFVLGRNKAGTLRLAEDDQGLSIEIDPPDTSVARDLQVSIQRKDISQMSIGFYARGANFYKSDGVYHRDLTEIQLFDVSPVTFAAFEGTDVDVRTGTRGLDVVSPVELLEEYRTRSGEREPADWRRQLDERERRLRLLALQ